VQTCALPISFTGPALLHSAGTNRQQSPILLAAATGNAVTTGGQSFAALRAALTTEAQLWGGLADRGVVTKSQANGVLELKGTDPVLNVFDVTATQWSGTSVIHRITAPAGSTVLVNIV